jgi:glyoxylase-like metal-dependent hydrolase (beta-lactamase superfamily II)
VGEVEITRVLEFEAALFEPAVIHPEASLEIIERHRSWLTPTLMDPICGLMIFAFHSTIIKTPRATILVDTCSGNDKERPHKLRYHRKNWPYLANLAAAGFVPEGIDHVLCTHMHADHVGWNTRLVNGRWVPTFPNARYLFAR